MTVELHQFVLDWDLPNASPFCLKVETYLRLVDQPYTVVPWNPMSAPLGKAPVLRIDGDVVADSSCILHTLQQRPNRLGDGHPPDKLATAHAIVRMLEEHTYFGLLVLRWLQDEPWATYRWVIGDTLPAPVRRPMTWWLRRGVARACWAQGLGRHPVDEVVRRVQRDLQCVEDALVGPFLLGEQLCPHDASVYAFLEVLRHPVGTQALAPAFASGTKLRAYVDHMRSLAWPDWDFA